MITGASAKLGGPCYDREQLVTEIITVRLPLFERHLKQTFDGKVTEQVAKASTGVLHCDNIRRFFAGNRALIQVANQVQR